MEAFSPNKDRLAAYVAEMQLAFPGRIVRAGEDAEACVRGAELVVTTTPSTTGIVSAAWLDVGCTLVCVGSDTPGKQELETAVVEKADKVICDSEAQWSACHPSSSSRHFTHTLIAPPLLCAVGASASFSTLKTRRCTRSWARYG
jgi:ornithine cyclodeaminase/alanine dehydrogenase-like protein (mu-crystallin family)